MWALLYLIVCILPFADINAASENNVGLQLGRHKFGMYEYHVECSRIAVSYDVF